MRKMPASQHLAQAMHNVRIPMKVRKRHWSNLPRESETKRLTWSDGQPALSLSRGPRPSSGEAAVLMSLDLSLVAGITL